VSCTFCNWKEEGGAGSRTHAKDESGDGYFFLQQPRAFARFLANHLEAYNRESLLFAVSSLTTLPPFSDVFTQQKKIEISTPYDPVHLTHVGFNSDTGEFTVSGAYPAS